MDMKMKLFILMFFVLNSYLGIAQSLRYPISQPYISLSAYSVYQNDPMSFTGNQAALARSKNAGAGVFGERRFLLNETSAYTFAVALPTRLGNFGVQLNYAGFKNFNENKIGLAYARSLGKRVDVGVQFNYYGYRIPAYGNASTVNFEMGTIIHVSDKLHAGLHVYNPVAGKLGKNSREKLASAYKFGLGYDASDKFFISSEVIKEEDKPVNIIAGLQYSFVKQFFLRAGFSSESGGGYFGAGIGWKNLRVDLSSAYHPQLGFSPGILLIMNFKNKGE